jgi:hypothetical protein
MRTEKLSRQNRLRLRMDFIFKNFGKTRPLGHLATGRGSISAASSLSTLSSIPILTFLQWPSGQVALVWESSQNSDNWQELSRGTERACKLKRESARKKIARWSCKFGGWPAGDSSKVCNYCTPSRDGANSDRSRPLLKSRVMLARGLMCFVSSTLGGFRWSTS